MDGDIYDKAACLLKKMIKRHAFASENRRTAFVIKKHFLISNNAEFNITDNPSYAAPFRYPASLLPKENELIIKLYDFNAVLKQAALEYSPAVIANYVYDLSKEFSQYYHDVPILKEEMKDLILFRLHLSKIIGNAIKDSMKLLGIEVPERM